MTKKIFVLFFLCLFCGSVFAAPKTTNTSIEGLALVKINSKKISLELEQAVFVNNKQAGFVALDDFGGQVFTIQFSATGMLIVMGGDVRVAKKKSFSKLLSLPVTQEEFLQILKYQPNDDFLVLKEKNKVVWKKKNEEKLSVVFDNFIKTKSKEKYPKHIFISHKKNSFDLKWITFKKLK